MLCVAAADGATVLEAEAYLRGMVAALAVEDGRWAVARGAYETVERVYQGMAGVRAGTVGAAVFERRVEEVVQGIRFCNYQMVRGGGEVELESLRGLAGVEDALAGKIEQALAEARRTAALEFGEVEWCGVRVRLRAEKVREAVLMAREESDRFVGGAVDEFDKLFMVYNDAIKVVSDELAEFLASGSAADDRIRELQLLVAYLTYNRLQHTVARNLLLVESFRNKRGAKPDDFVRLYDNLISNLTDILALPGVDNDAETSNKAESRRKLFKAYRCFHLAQSYLAAQLQVEAASLFDRVAVHAKSLTGKDAAEADKIVAESTGMKCRAKAQAFLKEQQLAGRIDRLSLSKHHTPFVKKEHILDNLDSYQSFTGKDDPSRVISEMPPALEAVPCKPVLFDLAIDAIRFPEEPKLEKQDNQILAEEQGKQTPAAATSAFQPLASTRLGRWWSGKG